MSRVGVRAITMQQPFASAMANGQGLFTRRGKPTEFRDGEWIAIHVGSNSCHMKNKSLMKEIRNFWGDCPSDEELLSQQKCLIGFAHFVDGGVSCDSDEVQNDFYLQRYDCTKKIAWKADLAFKFKQPISYPKGQLQIWHVTEEGLGTADNLKLLNQEIMKNKKSGRKVSPYFLQAKDEEKVETISAELKQEQAVDDQKNVEGPNVPGNKNSRKRKRTVKSE